MDTHLEGLFTEDNHVPPSQSYGWSDQAVSIRTLPNEVMLGVFRFYLIEVSSWEAQIGKFTDEDQAEPFQFRDPFDKKSTEAWHLLAHVCQRWRSIVFGAPLSLDLKLVCTSNTPARDTLDVWPKDLPVCVRCSGHQIAKNADNLIAALERSNRVVQIIFLGASRSNVSILLKAMQKPFLKLKELRIATRYKSSVLPPIIPSSFLGESAPSLKLLELDTVKFVTLPTLLLSTTHLVELIVNDLSYLGYISPRNMLITLFALTSLEYLWLEFKNFKDIEGLEMEYPTNTHLQAVLPALTFFHFEGPTNYLEELMVHVDAPQLTRMCTALINHMHSNCEFKVPGLVQFIRKFISRTSTIKALEAASVVFQDGHIMIKFWEARKPLFREQASAMSLHLHCQSDLATLYLDLRLKFDHVYGAVYKPQGEHLQDGALWLRLLRSFTVVKYVYLSDEFLPRIMHVLQELVGGRTRQALPLLQNIFVEGLEPSGPIQEAVGRFIAEQQASGHPIAVTRWKFQ